MYINKDGVMAGALYWKIIEVTFNEYRTKVNHQGVRGHMNCQILKS